MLLEFAWLEIVIIVGALLLVFGPERVNEFVDDLRTLWNDARVFIRGRKP
jgi:Sec-independent protein translocase protein TatA